MSELTQSTTDAERQDPVDLAQELARRERLTDVELYRKSGRSRVFVVETQRQAGEDQPVRIRQQARDRTESGWAIRYGNKRGSGFQSGTGELPAQPVLDRPHGYPLDLPQEVGDEVPIQESAALLTETIALRAVDRLSRVLPPPKIARRLEIQDGEAHSTLANNHGVFHRWHHRVGSILLEERLASGMVLRLSSVAADAASAVAEAEKSWLQPLVQASQVRGSDVSDQLTERVSAVVLAPAAAPFLAAAMSSWFSSASSDQPRLVANPVVQVSDAPDWPQGPLSVTVDGRGQPLQHRAIVADGEIQGSVWTDSDRPWVRHGWRDLPQPGFHQPIWMPGVAAVEELIAGVGEGWLLTAAVEVPVTASRARPMACIGVKIVDGQVAEGADARARVIVVQAEASEFCRGIRELAADLRFVPTGFGVLGIPAMRIEGLRLSTVVSRAAPEMTIDASSD